MNLIAERGAKAHTAKIRMHDIGSEIENLAVGTSVVGHTQHTPFTMDGKTRQKRQMSI